MTQQLYWGGRHRHLLAPKVYNRALGKLNKQDYALLLIVINAQVIQLQAENGDFEAINDLKHLIWKLEQESNLLK